MFNWLHFVRKYKGGYWIKYRIKSTIGTWYKWVQYESKEKYKETTLDYREDGVPFSAMVIAVEDHTEAAK